MTIYLDMFSPVSSGQLEKFGHENAEDLVQLLHRRIINGVAIVGRLVPNFRKGNRNQMQNWHL